jgi:trehalose 2-sulfotransferase
MRACIAQPVTTGGRAIPIIEPKLSYLICATPRSGSTFLCEALGNTGISGRPAEHFEVLIETGRPRRPRDYFQRSNDPEVWGFLDDPEFQEVLGEQGGWYGDGPAEVEVGKPPDFEKLRRAAFEKGTTENGVFGTKIMWAYFRDFTRLARRAGRRDVAPGDIPSAVFPSLGSFVWIRRRDTVRQAVSLWKALQTWEWKQDSDSKAEKPKLRFSYAAVDHLKLRIDEHNAAWKKFFSGYGIRPVEIVYEDFVKDYKAATLRLLDQIGVFVPENFTIATTNMKRQSDSLSEEWVREYLQGRHERSLQEDTLA